MSARVKDVMTTRVVAVRKNATFKEIAGLLGEYMIEGLLRVPVEVHYASEFRYNNPVLRKTDLALVISQSGETADTLAALRLCKEQGVPTLGIVNVVGSSIARDCDGVLYTQAGPEICVASTKAYSAQVATLALVALYAGRLRGADKEKISRLTSALRLPGPRFPRSSWFSSRCRPSAPSGRPSLPISTPSRRATSCTPDRTTPAAQKGE